MPQSKDKKLIKKWLQTNKPSVQSNYREKFPVSNQKKQPIKESYE